MSTARRTNSSFSVHPFSLRIPEKWEAYMTGGMVGELMRKGWRVYVGNDTKPLEDYIVCTEEEEEPDHL